MLAAISKPIAATTRAAIMFKVKADSEIIVSSARVKRTATLDGGAVIDHQGYSVGDRTIELRGMVTETEAADLWAAFKESTYLILHTIDGSFYGAISDLKIDRGDLRLTFLAKEAA
jgi:hypothetical protein